MRPSSRRLMIGLSSYNNYKRIAMQHLDARDSTKELLKNAKSKGALIERTNASERPTKISIRRKDDQLQTAHSTQVKNRRVNNQTTISRDTTITYKSNLDALEQAKGSHGPIWRPFKKHLKVKSKDQTTDKFYAACLDYNFIQKRNTEDKKCQSQKKSSLKQAIPL